MSRLRWQYRLWVTWACMGLINIFGRSPRDMAAPGKR
jgi:hypothetical protein